MQSNKLYPGLKEVLLQCQYPWCAANVEARPESNAGQRNIKQTALHCGADAAQRTALYVPAKLGEEIHGEES